MSDRSKKERARLFSVVSSNGTRGNGHKLKYRKLHLNITMDLRSVREIKTLEPVAQRSSGVSILGDAQNPSLSLS